ncbi:NAD(P)H-dependent oxidoreductase [Alteromonas sp. LMIT006]|uniref:FMN-dependent NADH-azoreductase n=1 Tax=Alteromonadaceae TaxID=72275 RepID=UPI0020CA2B18|nr:NAD(P)H-dependent oxidoreductase [Alteromonas sp. LMIT006]UTP73557.1 NAD(P)H-dependent oxidoreductase [Alteromonas sp. LMIT006]
MTQVFVVNASIQGDNGNSSALTAHYVSKLSGVAITKRDLTPNAIPSLSSEAMRAWMTDTSTRTAEQNELAQISDDLIAEVQAADTIVIGMPMYNFGAPSTFKAWVDHIARAGVTFRYTETGPQGLLDGKKVIIAIASGGKYKGTPMDTLTPWLHTFFNFLGLTDVHVVHAEGLGMEEPETVLNAAKAELEALV